MSLYLKGKARKWFFTRFKNHRTLKWEQFKREVTRRFTEQGYHNVIADLHDLKQIGSVEEYQSKFEDLKSQVLKKEPCLTETYFISAFIGGLQGDLRNFVQMLKPNSLDEAIALARLQEGGFNNLLAKARTQSHPKTFAYPSTNITNQKSYSSAITNSQKTPSNPVYTYSPSLKTTHVSSHVLTTSKTDIKTLNTNTRGNNYNAILQCK